MLLVLLLLPSITGYEEGEKKGGGHACLCSCSTLSSDWGPRRGSCPASNTMYYRTEVVGKAKRCRESWDGRTERKERDTMGGRGVTHDESKWEHRGARVASGGEWSEIGNMEGVRKKRWGMGKKEEWGRWWGEKEKKSEVGGGKSTSIIGQAVVQSNVEDLTRRLPSTSAVWCSTSDIQV